MKKWYRKRTSKLLAVLLAVLLTGGATGIGCSAESSGSGTSGSTETIQDVIEDTVQFNTDTGATDKEENVYVIADAAGNTDEVIVSDWLKNPDAADTLTDYSTLSGIQNTSGDEQYTCSQENVYVWDAAGSDIHYQGTSGNDLPVAVHVTYSLDGQELTPEEIAGKSGHVTIRFTYDNLASVSTVVDGKTEDIAVPFLMVSGVLLDGSIFSNVTVSSGTVLNDGSRNIVIGYAMPGLSDSLQLDIDDLDIPEYVEIEADTTGFSLDGTLTMATPDLFDSVEINPDGGLADLQDSLTQLQDAALQLVDGTSDLYSGTVDLHSGVTQLVTGINTLLSGAEDLKDGASDLSSGASSLRDGLSVLSGNSASLNGGAKEVTDAIFDSATTQLRAELVSGGLMSEAQAASVTLTSDNYESVFASLISEATVTSGQVEAQLRTQLSAMTSEQQDMALTIAYDLMSSDASLTPTAAITKAAAIMQDAGTAQAACSVIDNSWLIANSTLIGSIVAGTGADTATAAKLAAVALYLDAANPMNELSAAQAILQNAAVVAATTADNNKIAALCTAIAAEASSGGNQLAAAKADLDNVMSFYRGLLAYTAGVDSAYSGSQDLASGASSLSSGASDLYSGVVTLYAGGKQLVSGSADLQSGSQELRDAMQQFYDDGITKLVSAFGGDYSGLLSRLQAVSDAGRSYQNFSGISENMTGSVRFIFRTDSIE